ncbi:MAG TPA: hypothetical protein VNY35_08345 [Solirubrobacteraceae bacterium]|nr:hypothetical protein [Solirubrobacteraceae bacterium]
MRERKPNPNERKVTRRAWTSVSACLALVLLAFAAACGSKSSNASQSTSTAAAAAASVFASHANAVCAQPQPPPPNGPFPYPSFNPLHPERSKLPAIGRYFERAGGLAIVTKELAQLRALGTPPSHQADWRRLLAAKQARVTATAKQIQAALVTDAPTFIATVNTLTAVMDQERAAASALGAPACAPPPENQAQGIPLQAQGIPLAGGALSQLAACMRANGIAVQVNKTPGNGPPLTSTVPLTDPKYQAAGAKCRARLASRFPELARVPTPP